MSPALTFPMQAVRVAEPSLPPPTCVPMEGSIDVDGIGMSGVGVNDNDDGKQLDRLLRWTGLITAAKMGVSRVDDSLALESNTCCP